MCIEFPGLNFEWSLCKGGLAIKLKYGGNIIEKTVWN